MHDREILSRYRRFGAARGRRRCAICLRRARGYAPLPLALPVASPVPLLAVGPHLKNTFTLVHGDRAWVSPHIGDLENLERLEHFRLMLAVYRRLFGIDPEAVVHDLHPGYLSTRIAPELGLPTTLAVQHHHAHIAAVMAEHGVTDPVLGVAYDGTGYGTDGRGLGRRDPRRRPAAGFQRLGHLRYAPLPGGDLAARRPWRVALGYASLDLEARLAMAPMLAAVPAAERAVAERQLEARINAPLASSMGRLFDAAAAVIGLRLVSAYEGQAAMELEALAGDRLGSEFEVPIEDDGEGAWQMNPVPLLAWLALRRQRGAHPGDLAADFHASVAAGDRAPGGPDGGAGGSLDRRSRRRGVPERPPARLAALAAEAAGVPGPAPPRPPPERRGHQLRPGRDGRGHSLRPEVTHVPRHSRPHPRHPR